MSRRMLGNDEGRLIKALGCVALLAALLALAVVDLLRRWSGCRWR